MKKALLALALVAIASTASAQIASSKHDLTTGYNGNTATTTMGSCQFCHAPHYGNVSSPTGVAADGYAQIPLWNRRTPNAANYSRYENVAGGAASVVIGTGSYTCLSCHDGVSDMGQTFRGTTGFNGVTVRMMDNAANLAGTWDATSGLYVPGNGTNTDLRDDHPVGVPYTGTGAVGGYALAADVTTANLKLYTRGVGGLSVECGSCHDPHLSTNTKFLRITGDLCGVCHLK